MRESQQLCIIGSTPVPVSSLAFLDGCHRVCYWSISNLMLEKDSTPRQLCNNAGPRVRTRIVAPTSLDHTMYIGSLHFLSQLYRDLSGDANLLQAFKYEPMEGPVYGIHPGKV
ncbi:hypothetical protein D9758_014496 [Tetrapyrgos nigripes]|uniref:Uncharacterized protein n=1 Tax=Tetrapyrgos nigripes TaxID=182062 RepID=A0A8H5FGG0_9AGAR|nr:hypothetical protein D9758_014496 [Tetrapyrgos nigripes]